MTFNKSKNCEYCNKLFQYYDAPAHPNRTKYCSVICQRKGRPIGFSTIEESFFSKVIKNINNCWDWNGHLKDGYGCFRFKSRKNLKAHRVSWEIHFGEIPAGMYVCHKCDNRKCSNPEHLFLGTHVDNIKDMISKNRHKGASGSRNVKSKLTEKDIPIIRNRINEGEVLKNIAQDYKVTISAIWSIKTGLRWKHV